MVDLKSPYTYGHSTAVAEFAAAAGRRLGLGEGDVETLPAGCTIWGDWGCPLARSDALASLARLAGMHHERQDGSGYYRQASAGHSDVRPHPGRGRRSPSHAR